MRFIQDENDDSNYIFCDCLNNPLPEYEMEQYGIKGYKLFRTIYDWTSKFPVAFLFQDNKGLFHGFDAVTMKRFTKPEGYFFHACKVKAYCGDVIAFWNDEQKTSLDIYCKGICVAENAVNYDIIKDKAGIKFLIIKNAIDSYDLYNITTEKFIMKNMTFEIVDVDSRFEQVIMKSFVPNHYAVHDFNGKSLCFTDGTKKLCFTDVRNYFIAQKVNKTYSVLVGNDVIAENCKEILCVTENYIATINRVNNIHILEIMSRYLVGSGKIQYYSVSDNYSFPKCIIDVQINNDAYLESILTVSTPTQENPHKSKKILLQNYIKIKNLNAKFTIQAAEDFLYDEIKTLETGELEFIKFKGEGKPVEVTHPSSAINKNSVNLVQSFLNWDAVNVVMGGVLHLENGKGDICNINEIVIPDDFKSSNINFMTEKMEGTENLYLYKDEMDIVSLYNLEQGTRKFVTKSRFFKDTIYPVFHNLYYNVDGKHYRSIDEKVEELNVKKAIAFNKYILFYGDYGYYNVKLLMKNGNTELFHVNWLRIDFIRQRVILKDNDTVHMFTNEGREKFLYGNVNIKGKMIFENKLQKDGIIIDTDYVSFDELKADIDSMIISSEYRSLLPVSI